jgi:hypothetical protein
MNEVPLMPLWVTLALTIWAAIGPMAGLLTGHLLSRSSQRKHWIADCKKQEYGELLRALMRHHFLLEDYLSSSGPMVGELERRIKEREEEAAIVIRIAYSSEDKLRAWGFTNGGADP